MAVPRDEPRFDTLRDRPEISPCNASGKLDWTTLTEGVSIAPSPRVMKRSPGMKASTLDQAATNASSMTTPVNGMPKPEITSVRCEYEHAQRPARADETRLRTVAAAN